MASRRPSALHKVNKLKLGLFSLNADGGIAVTKVPGCWRADWLDIADVAKLVDRAGFEFILPIARWKRFRRRDGCARASLRDIHVRRGSSSTSRTSCRSSLTGCCHCCGRRACARRENPRALLWTSAPALHPVNGARVTVQYVRQAHESYATFRSRDLHCGGSDAGGLRDQRRR